MSDDVTLGKLIDGEAHRDAIHIACAPVVSNMKLAPGQEIKLVEGSDEQVIADIVAPIGIVDPFLKTMVFPGQRFYMVLYPKTITSLRHEWTHPAFSTTPAVPSPAVSKSESEKWLRAYAARANSYDDPEAGFQRLLEGLRTNELFFQGSDLHGLYELYDADELKRHAETYLGITIDYSHFEFSCSC